MRFSTSAEKHRFPYLRAAWAAALFLSIPALFIYLAITHLWVLPAPGDPLDYLTPVIWQTTNYDHFIVFRAFHPTYYADHPGLSTLVHWPWLDRIALVLWLRLIALLPIAREALAPTAILVINAAVLIVSMAWALRRAGVFAALSVGALLASSYIFLAYATYLYADQAVTLFLLLALVCFLWSDTPASRRGRVVAAGAFTAAAVLSKGTGAAGILFFLAEFVVSRWSSLRQGTGWRDLIRDVAWFAAGGVGATAVILIAFAAAFGVDSVTAVFRAFFIEAWSLTRSGVSMGNLVTYVTPMLSLKLLPVFAALFILAGAWRGRDSGACFAMALCFLVVLTLMYALTTRGGSTIPNYIHAPLTLAAVGTAIHLASIAGLDSGPRDGRRYAWTDLAAATAVLACLLGSIAAVANFPQDVRIDYFFESGMRFDLPRSLAVSYTVLPLAMLALLTLTEVKRWTTAAVAFACCAALWGPAYPGGLAYAAGRLSVLEGEEYVNAARLLDQVPAERYTVAVERWSANEKWKSLDGWRVLWVYHVFYGERYGRTAGAAGKTRHQKAVLDNITWLRVPDELSTLKAGMVVLTDQPEKIAGLGYRFDEIATLRKSDLAYHVIAIRN